MKENQVHSETKEESLLKESEFDKDYHIDTQKDHDAVMALINKRNKPNAILCILMNAFESYRQARKIGWSRPWNKDYMINFQSFRLNTEEDSGLIAIAEKILKTECPDISNEALEFIESLLNTTQPLMGFVFVHEFKENGNVYEGATLSFGRPNNKRFRDRLDVIVESSIVDEVSQGFKRMRIYVDPYSDSKERKGPLWSISIDTELGPESSQLFSQLSCISKEWQNQTEKHWNHWTSDYIDYFGPRQQPVKNSYFYEEQLIEVANG